MSPHWYWDKLLHVWLPEHIPILILIRAYFIFLITIYNLATFSPEMTFSTRTRYGWLHFGPWFQMPWNLPPMWLHTVLASSTLDTGINDPYLLKLNYIWPGPSAIYDHSHMSRPFNLCTEGSWNNFCHQHRYMFSKARIDKTAKQVHIYQVPLLATS